MAFQIVNFTNAGLTTLQQIASSKSLVIDEVIPCSTLISENDVLVQPPAFFETYRNRNVTANIVSAGSDPNGINAARLVVSLQTTSTQSETICMLIVVAHSVEGGSATTANTFIGALDETGLVVTYNPNIPIKLNVALSFAFDRTANITIGESEANYLLHDEATRFVSTHSPSGPLVGENQTIYGDKTFNSKVILDTAYGGELDFYYDNDPLIRIYQGNDFGLIFNTTPNVAVFDTDHIYEFKVENQDIMLVGKNENGGVVVTDQVTATTGQFDVLKGRSQEEEIHVAAHIKPVFAAACGDIDSKWERVGTDRLFANSIQATDSSDGAIACLSTIKPNVTEAYNLGSTNKRWANVYAQTINCDDIIDSSGAGGVLLRTCDSYHQDTTEGMTIYDCPVGSIVEIYVSSGSPFGAFPYGLTAEFTVNGKNITTPNGQYTAWLTFALRGNNDSISASAQSALGNGTYKLLHAVDHVQTTGAKHFFLVRVR